MVRDASEHATGHSATALRARLRGGTILVLPGVHDPLSALVLESLGAEAAYVGGASFSYGQFGRPDLNTVTSSEMTQHVSRVRQVTSLPTLVDADTGFGAVLNVERTVRDYVAAGATAIQLEDQAHPKRCGHLEGRSVVEDEQMILRILAAQKVQQTSDFVLVARTDARTGEGFDEVVRRARLFQDLGVDAVFPESLETVQEYAELRAAVDLPLVANMVEGGRSPDLSAGELESMGYNAVIFPGSAVRSYVRALETVYAAILEHGTTRDVRDHQISFEQMQDRLGTAAVVAGVDAIVHNAQDIALRAATRASQTTNRR